MFLVKEGKGGGGWGASYVFMWLRGAPLASGALVFDIKVSLKGELSTMSEREAKDFFLYLSVETTRSLVALLKVDLQYTKLWPCRQNPLVNDIKTSLA